MADQQQPLKAPFPPPPPVYKSFTKANLTQLRKLRKEASTNDETAEPKQDPDILSLPPELRYLLPPSPPLPTETWTSFGNPLTLHPPPTTVASAGIEQLVPPIAHTTSNPQPHLLALARSLLTTFLSLVGILSRNPTLYASQVEDLQTICYNMHDLINQYRPHQARQSLIAMMEERLERLRGEIQRIEGGRSRVGGLMGALAESGGEREVKVKIEEGERGEVQGESGEAKVVERQRGAWAAIEKELGSETAVDG